MQRFVFNKPSKMFSKNNDDGNRILDFHKMVITVLKIFYKKQKPKIIHYRNYKTFNANLFKEELNNELLSIDNNNTELVEFTNTVLSILDKHAPIKRKYIRANNFAFKTKDLRAAIMKRSKLRQKFLKERTYDSKHLCNRERDLCVSLLQKTKRDYFKQLTLIWVGWGGNFTPPSPFWFSLNDKRCNPGILQHSVTCH